MSFSINLLPSKLGFVTTSYSELEDRKKNWYYIQKIPNTLDGLYLKIIDLFKYEKKSFIISLYMLLMLCYFIIESRGK